MRKTVMIGRKKDKIIRNERGEEVRITGRERRRKNKKCKKERNNGSVGFHSLNCQFTEVNSHVQFLYFSACIQRQTFRNDRRCYNLHHRKTNHINSLYGRLAQGVFCASHGSWLTVRDNVARTKRVTFSCLSQKSCGKKDNFWPRGSQLSSECSLSHPTAHSCPKPPHRQSRSSLPGAVHLRFSSKRITGWSRPWILILA
jgi:hypothetical protein